MKKMSVNEPTLIEIKQDMPGFDRFMASWVFRDEVNVVVDVGPANSAKRLIDALSTMGVERIDYILITHIHIDHAGALGELLDRYPDAKAVCHEGSIDHLADPSKLWEGARRVLGEVAEGYGPPKPVPRDRLIPHTLESLEGLEVIETPGHAPHHLCFSYKGGLFSGEAGGDYFNVDGVEYLRPATPPRLFLDVFAESVERLLALKSQPIYYAHFGTAEDSHRLLERFLDQLTMWGKIIGEEIGDGPGDIAKKALGRLLEEDPNLRAVEKLERETRRRELFFLESSVRGFIGYLEQETKLAP